MKRSFSLLALALLLAFAGVAFAGHGHEKCTDDTQACLNKLAAKIQEKGWLGVELEKNDYGYYKITEVVADSPAEAAGLRAGDVLVALNGIVLAEDNKDELKAAKRALGPGKSATYTVKRSGGKQQIAVTLGHVPALVMAEWIGQHMIEHHAETVVASAD